jgi:hypothetical protein
MIIYMYVRIRIYKSVAKTPRIVTKHTANVAIGWEVVAPPVVPFVLVEVLWACMALADLLASARTL